MLDPLTLRVAIGVSALVLVPLFGGVSYRLTRSPYAAWWSGSLLLFVIGSLVFAVSAPSERIWVNPVGNTTVVLGVSCSWVAVRTLRPASLGPAPLRWWQLAALPALTLVVTLLDHPSASDWAGGPVYLLSVATAIGLSCVELWRIQGAPEVRNDLTYVTLLRIVAAVSGSFALFTLARAVALVAAGPTSSVFTTVLGSGVTSLLTLVLLSTISFTMSTISTHQQVDELRERADLDALTGLLNRSAFQRLSGRRTHVLDDQSPVSVIVADLDHFKQINDTFGHAAGDQALVQFASACRGTVRGTDLVCRLGGDEFVLLLPGATGERALQVSSEISFRMRMGGELNGNPMPTASYGIATNTGWIELDTLVARADAALYEAKQGGRDRTAVDCTA